MTVRPVAIIVLTWNGLGYTRRCLESLNANTDHPDYRVIVADNGSTDGTLEYLRGLAWITLIENGQNLGFTRGNNIALRAAPPDADVVLLNNDIEIPQNDWLRRLQQTADSGADVGVVGCRMVHPNGQLLHVGAYMTPSFLGVQIGDLEKDINQHIYDKDCEAIVFACAYIKRKVLDRVGLLDEDYFTYCEDSDYCMKARMHGYRTVCCGGVTLIHIQNASTATNKVCFHGMLGKSREVFIRKWGDWFRDERYRWRLGWQSEMNSPNGYAVSSRQLAQALDRHGVQLGYRYYRDDLTPRTAEPAPELYMDGRRSCLIQERPLDPSEPQVVYAMADAFPRNSGSYRIGYTMLEVDGVPPHWVRHCNEMDEVWVPSTFNAETFRESGVTRPIHVMPLGLDPQYFNPHIVGQRDPRRFTFLSIFEWGERKAPEILLRAFSEEFDHSEDVVLLCKVMNNDIAVSVRRQVSEMHLRPGGGRIVISENDMVPTYQLGCLYRSVDCFVSCTRGEGWGMPLLEAMGCGLPVIATDWSAQRDFLSTEVAYPLRVERLVPAHARCPLYAGFRWAEPSLEHLRHLMRHVYEHRDEAAEVGRRASAFAHAQFSLDHSAKRIIDRLDALGLSNPRGQLARAT
jgi:GT2 family glycosyltransferase/glycosyltransferase involved in cell wall biosynthesis